jgi:uncharacterized protein involved in copper resistance
MQEPSLLEILQFQYPNVLSAQSMGADHANVPTIQSVKDLIDVRTTVFLQNFLPGWQDSGLLGHMSHAPPKVKTPKAGNNILVPLEALSMAQEVCLRLTQIVQYLHLVKGIYLLRIDRIRGKQTSNYRGQRLDSLAMESLLSNIYVNWDELDGLSQSAHKQKLKKANKQARRWLLIASRLSFGVLLIGSRLFERQV